MKFYSQANQDKWAYLLFKNKQNNFFIDIGALDGIEYSNTYALEKFCGWNGICIEANPRSFKKLQNNRNSFNINAAISDHDGFVKICGEGPGCKVSDNGELIESHKLKTILDRINCQKDIDYLSIDIEGSEYVALDCFDFDKYFIKILTIEHNLYVDGPKNKNALFELMSSKGFVRVVEDVKCLVGCPSVYNQPYEDWYINSKCTDLLSDPIAKIQPI